MTVVAVLSQTLRESHAATYLDRHETGGRRLVVTRRVQEIDTSLFGDGVEFVAWAPASTPRPSARAVSNVVFRRMRSAARSGSRSAMRVERWLKSAEWRLRYVDRLLSLLAERSSQHPDLKNDHLLSTLREILVDSDTPAIVVFDLFDLPTVLLYREESSCEISIR